MLLRLFATAYNLNKTLRSWRSLDLNITLYDKDRYLAIASMAVSRAIRGL